MKKILPQLLKGTREFLPVDMAKRNLVLGRITEIFKRFGYDTIETPILSPAETILGKYGEEGDKLTYSFDSRGTQIALPYDQTVPFARLVAGNWRELPMPFKRYQVQRVWRAERPQKGRLREFYQCDIDIIGTKSLIAEAEVLKIIVEVFKALEFEKFYVKINSRRLINSILTSFDVSEEKMLDVIRVIDKMDKIGAEEVARMLREIGVKNEKKLLELLVVGKTNEETMAKLKDYDLAEIKEFFEFASYLGVEGEYVKFDPALARGLDYYTGMIYEAIDEETSFGSLAGGGRYDNLCGTFSDADFSGVGVAFGFERLMMALEGKLKDVKLNSQALITLFSEDETKDALNLYAELTAAGVNCEVYYEADQLGKQFKYADKKQIPFVIVQGPEEKTAGNVTVKSMRSGKQQTIPVEQLIPYLTSYYEA